MNSLLELQSSFSRSVIANCDDIQPWLTESKTPTLAIYRNAYQIRLRDTLAEDYPALRKLLGDDAFTAMATEFIGEFPSVSFSLRSVGQLLSNFLNTHANYRQQSYLTELAALEWQLTDVFDVADTPVAAIEDVATIPPQAWPSLTVKLDASIRWLALRWNIGEIYPTLKNNSVAPDLVKLPRCKHYLVWRHNNSPHYRFLDTQEMQALIIFENKNFSALCHSLSVQSDSPDDAAMQAATYLKSWLAAGLIESVSSELI